MPEEARAVEEGLGTEAFQLWIQYLFAHYDLLAVRTATWSGNVRRVRMAAKCGFVEIERKIRHREWQGIRYDALVFELIRQRWRELEGVR